MQQDSQYKPGCSSKTEVCDEISHHYGRKCWNRVCRREVSCQPPRLACRTRLQKSVESKGGNPFHQANEGRCRCEFCAAGSLFVVELSPISRGTGGHATSSCGGSRSQRWRYQYESEV